MLTRESLIEKVNWVYPCADQQVSKYSCGQAVEADETGEVCLRT